MSEIKDRQDAASDIDPIVAAQADDTLAAAAVEGFDEAAEPVDAEAIAVVDAQSALEADASELSDGADGDAAGPVAAADIAARDEVAEGESLPTPSGEAPYTATEADEPAADAAAGIADAIEAALLGGVPEPLAAGSFENMPAAYADTVVELDATTDSADADAPLLDSDLEDGIASVFAALHAARDDSAPVEPLGDLEAADGVTFRLLGELDRLWHRAA